MGIRIHLILVRIVAVVLMASFFMYGGGVASVRAQSEIDALKNQITERGERLKEIEKEIAAYQTELKKVGGEKNSLQKAINQVEPELEKMQADSSYA